MASPMNYAALGTRSGAMSPVAPTGYMPQKDVIPKGYNRGQISNWEKPQHELFGQLFGYLSPDSPTSRLAQGDQSYFGQLEAPALRQLGELQGGLASRFAGMGSFGGTRSSGFQNAQGALASDFAQQLQSQRLGLQRQALQDLFGMSEMLLGQRPYDKFITPKGRKFWQELLLGGTPGLAQGASQGGSLALLKALGML